MPEHDGEPADRLRLQLLVLRCQAGDEGAFAELFRLFGPRTRRYLQRLVAEEADDLQQEVWLAVYRHLGALSNPGAFRTWLYQTTRHRALDFLRRGSREQRLLLDAMTEADPRGPEDPTTAGSGLAEFELREVADRLPPAQRELLLLRYQDDLSYAEIALVLGCPIGTVKSRLHLAHQRVQQLLAPGDR